MDESWRAAAACRDVPIELIYPAEDDPLAVEIMTTFAMTCCYLCPVRAECLAEALMHNDQYGVWGGELPNSRRRQPL